MRVVEDIGTMRSLCREQRRRGARVGFVPTMGCLHEGHLSLVRLARSRADWVVASVFVNPTQFAPGEDYDRYPRDLDRDRSALEAEGCDVLFAPSREAMYPQAVRTRVIVEGLSEKLCGRSRPGHFAGVATVVLKLLHIVEPDVAVFGEKDAQQLVIVRRLVADLDLDVEIEAGPTVREPDGLAASSRNAYLTADQRRQATCLIRALRGAESLVELGERRAARLVETMRRIIEAEPAAEIDYVAVVDPQTLEDLETLGGRALAALAVRVGRTRLIDNTWLNVGR